MANEGIIVGIIIFVLVVVSLVAIFAARYKKVPPDKAMVVYGRRIKKEGQIGYQVISGGGKFIIPIIESFEYLPLDVRTLDVGVNDIVTDVVSSGAKINIKSVTHIKISSEENSLKVAAEHLLHKSNAARRKSSLAQQVRALLAE